MFVYNKTDNVFKAGEKVWIANTLLPSETPFEVQVIKVIPSEETFGLGLHYLLYITTWIEDRLEVRPANQVFRSKDQFESICKDVTDQRRSLRENAQGIADLFNRPIPVRVQPS
jgi:hypothetical protein